MWRGWCCAASSQVSVTRESASRPDAAPTSSSIPTSTASAGASSKMSSMATPPVAGSSSMSASSALIAWLGWVVAASTSVSESWPGVLSLSCAPSASLLTLTRSPLKRS